MDDQAAAEMAAIAAIGDGRRRRRRGSRVGAETHDVVAGDGQGIGIQQITPLDVQDNEMMQIVAVGNKTTKRKLDNNSNEMMYGLRMAKKASQQKNQLVKEKATRDSWEKQLQLASIAFPGLRQMAVFKNVNVTDSLVKAGYSEALSMRRVQPAGPLNTAQARSAFLVASTIETLQAQQTGDILFGNSSPDATGRICMLTWQSDETKQRTRFKFKTLFNGAKSPTMQTSIDILVGGGRQYLFQNSEEPVKETVYYPKALQLFGKNTAFLFAGLLKQFPIKLDGPTLQEMAAANETVLIAFGTDRCATEFSMLRLVWDRIHTLSPLSVLPHAEPCGTHGGPLVKGRAPHAKEVNKMLHGFSRLARQGKDLRDMHAELYADVSAHASYVVGDAPDDVKAAREVSAE